MRDVSGQNAFQNTVLIVLSSDAKEASRVQKLASVSNLRFVEELAQHGLEIFPEAILTICDEIVHNPEVHLSPELRDYLHDLKILRDAVTKIADFTLMD